MRERERKKEKENNNEIQITTQHHKEMECVLMVHQFSGDRNFTDNSTYTAYLWNYH